MSKKEIAFRCSECSELFPPELVDEILRGKTVLCERCGFPFRSSFTKKDYKEMGSPPIQTPKLKQQQTSAYNVPKQPKEPSKSAKSKSKSKQQYKYIPSPRPRKSKKKEIHVNGIKIPTEGLKERIPVSDIDNLKKSIKVMNDLCDYPLLLINLLIGLLILGITLPKAIEDLILGSPVELYEGVMSIILNIFRVSLILYVWILNYRIVIKPIKDGSYTNLGIDAILLGFISLPLYGLGTFYLFEGFFILLYEIFTRHNHLYDLGKRDKLSQDIFAANFMESTIKVINEVSVKGTVFLLVYSIIPFVKKMLDFTSITGTSIASFVYHVIFFGIALAYTIYLKVKFTKSVNSKPYQEISDEILIRNIVFSFFSLFYAAVGIIGLLSSILLFNYRKMYRNVKKKLPSIQYVKSDTPPKSFESAGTEAKIKTPPSQNKLSKEGGNLPYVPPTPSPKKDSDRLQEIPVVRVDDKEARKQLITSLKKSEKQKPEPPPGKPPVVDKGDIKDYMDRVFTVLTADIRDRLMKLDIPEDQKYDVVLEFVHLKQEQQQKYLEELENVNRVLSEELIKRVKKMKLPQKDTSQIIKQLRIMGPKEQVEFVEFLEHSQ